METDRQWGRRQDLEAGLRRAFDVVIAGTALVVLMPVIAAAALAVFVRMGPPVLFRHERAGRAGAPFVLLKLRTMRKLRGSGAGRRNADRRRLTRLGRLLRATSIDELPSLVNVLRGEMSLVGPRPLPARYLPRYTQSQARRHEVRPGVTGWAQVNGRNAMGWDNRLEYDLWYVANQSFALDLAIIGRTFVSVVRRSGISHHGHATMPELPEPHSR
ncbi:MAG: sugar transferase [Jiangellaceae bacterium]